MKAKLKAAELRVPDTPQAREQEVQSGRAVVFMTDYPFSRRMLDDSDWARLVSPTETFHVTSCAWAMQPGDDAFHARVEEILAAMKRDGRLPVNARRYGLDPQVRPRHGVDAVELGRSLNAALPLSPHPGDMPGSIEAGQFDKLLPGGRPVLTAYRASSQFPVVVAVHVDRERVLAAWRAEARSLVISVVPILLALSKRLVESMGGTIEVSSEVGVGSRFRFVVRLRRDEHARATVAAAEH